MRRLEAHHREPGAAPLAQRLGRPLAHDIALVPVEADRLGEPRAVEPRVVEQEAALEPLPEIKAAPAVRRDDDPCMVLAGEIRPAVP